MWKIIESDVNFQLPFIALSFDRRSTNERRHTITFILRVFEFLVLILTVVRVISLTKRLYGVVTKKHAVSSLRNFAPAVSQEVFALSILDTLPKELLIKIIKYLNVGTWSSLSRTGKKWKYLCHDDLIWKYYLQRDFPHSSSFRRLGYIPEMLTAREVYRVKRTCFQRISRISSNSIGDIVHDEMRVLVMIIYEIVIVFFKIMLNLWFIPVKAILNVILSMAGPSRLIITRSCFLNIVLTYKG